MLAHKLIKTPTEYLPLVSRKKQEEVMNMVYDYMSLVAGRSNKGSC